jgi:hypothetical protein
LLVSHFLLCRRTPNSASWGTPTCFCGIQLIYCLGYLQTPFVQGCFPICSCDT